MIDIALDPDQLPQIIKPPVTSDLANHWLIIASHQQADKSILNILIVKQDIEKQQLQLLLPEVDWIQLRAIIDAAFDMALFAVQLALRLAGIMALWLGLIKITEQSGLVNKTSVYETLVDGAKDGFSTAVRIITYLVAILFVR